MRPILAAVAFLLATAGPAQADVLELKDGRFVEGAVERTGEAYLVRSRFGETTIAADQVVEWTKARPVDDQVRERLAGLAPDDAENRALLACWLRDLGRSEEARALAESVLEIDPESASAHEVLGHIRHQGVWRTPEEAKRAEGFELHGDKWYTPEEWVSLEGAAREEAVRAEAEAAARRRGSDVNEAVRLMTSPDPLVRARGKARLEALAEEHDSDAIRRLVGDTEAYVRAADEYAAAAASPDSAFMMGELRVTLSRLKRPITNFETSLASGPVTAAAPVRIQLPELEVIKVNTTIGMPAVIR
jgi:hypothetical protein